MVGRAHAGRFRSMDPAPPAADVAPARRPAPRWIVFLGTGAALGVLGSLQVVFSMRALGAPLHGSAFLRGRALEVSVQLALAALALLLVERRWAPQRVGTPRYLAAAFLALVPVVVVGTEALSVLGRLLFGAGGAIRGSLAAKAIVEWIMLAMAVTVAAVHDLHRRLRDRDAQALQLEARLAEARLQALASQLQPHFLFNTLTAVSVLVHRDPRAADTMLTRLADLLRATLRRPGTHEIPLGEELALLDRYLDIMRVRHGPRLTVRVDAAGDLHALLVPCFLLQPLVENALEHGVARRAGPGVVVVAAARDGDRLRLTIEDDGPGLAAGARDDTEGSGIGLTNTRRRLEQLYGAAQRLELEHRPGAGTRVVVEIPARPATSGTTARDGLPPRRRAVAGA